MQITENLASQLIDRIVDNFDHFRENPPHLAWAVMNYELIRDLNGQEAFVVIDTSEVSPIQKAYEKLSEDDSNLLSAAFDLVNSSFGRFPDGNPNAPLQWKSNKTLDEWVELLASQGDYDYFTYSRDEVLSDFLIKSHSNKRWNKEGYLVRVERSGVESRIFFGYTRIEREVPESIREAIVGLREYPEN